MTLQIPKLWLLFLVLFIQSVEGVHPNFHLIDNEDKEILEMFFDDLLHTSEISLTLCGEKPVSSETFISISQFGPKSIKNFPRFIFEGNAGIQWSGSRCWKKNMHLFPSSKFKMRFLDEGTLLLFNKKATVAIIKDNLELFQNALKLNYSSHEIFEVISSQDKNIYLNPLFDFGYLQRNTWLQIP